MSDVHRRPHPWPTSEGVVVGDGAMGTMLHSAGLPLGRSISELNVVSPRLVRDLHAAYLAAGADILQTNTYDANRSRLADIGYGDRVAEINIAGARLAREAVLNGERHALVAGSVGPARGGGPASRVPDADRETVLREQVAALADWVDLIMLETFGEIASLTQAVEAALAECDVPVVAQMTFAEDGRTLRGEAPAEVAAALAGYDLAALGANCTVGPAVLQDVVAELAAATGMPIVVQPNAGTPKRLGNGLRYAHNTAYFADAAVELVGRGACIVGGCCGTTPGHVRAVARAVAGLTVAQRPARRRDLAAVRTSPASAADRQAGGAPAGPVAWPDLGRPVVVAGLQPPRGPDAPEYVEAARAVVAAGADMLATVDPDPSTARVNPVAAAVLLSERTAVGVMLPVETAGRSLAALQADLLGGYAFGLRTVVCRTGTVRFAGDYPEPGISSDVDSVRLVAMLAGLNDGVDWRGVPIPERTRFLIGASVRVSAVDAARELDRVSRKVGAGAHFLVTDVVYDAARASAVLHDMRARGITVPVLMSVAPFRTARTIARLTHEMPESLIPESALAVHEPGRDLFAQTTDLAQKLVGVADGIFVVGQAVTDDRMASLIGRLSTLCRAQGPAT